MYSTLSLLLFLSFGSGVLNNNISSFYAPVIELFGFPFNFSTSNNECNENVELFSASLENNTLWAYRMWDSSTKLPLGLTEGSQYQLGDFDECLSIQEPFSTQYCLATINIDIRINRTINDPFSLKYRPYMNIFEKLDYTNDPNQIKKNKVFWGLCVPSSCQTEDIKNELQRYLNKQTSSHVQKYQVQIDNIDCQTGKTALEYELTAADFLFCFVVGLFIFLVGVGTTYHLKYLNGKHKNDINNKTERILLCFSAKENFQELGKPEGDNKNFRIFYGTKFFIMLSLVCGHSLDNMMTGSVFNFKDIEQINRALFFMIFDRGDVVVDMFFCIGGLLNTYNFLIQTDRKNFNALRAIILRYFRSVPTFAILTFFYSTLLYKIGSGPLWPKIIGPEQEYCKENWWTNILLINNYINVEHMCMLQGWYLAVDFQLFILSIPLNYLIKNNTKLSWITVIGVLCGSIVTPFLIIYLNNKEPIFYSYNNFFLNIRSVDNFQTIYVPTHTRMSTYIIGMILGFIYYKLRDSTLKISLVKSVMISIPATLMGLTCIYGGILFYIPNLPYNALYSALYGALHRTVVVIGGGTLLFVLSFGSIPPHILTWLPMIPLSKLSFNVYMVHLIFQLMKQGLQRTPAYFSIYFWFSQGFTEYILSSMVAFLLYLLVENPCIKIMKEIIPSNGFKKKSKSESKEIVLRL